MAKMLDHDLAEDILKKYFHVTCPILNPEMGLRLKTVREKLNLTQRKMADLLGLNQTQICRIESGEIINSPLTCQEFRAVLKIHFEYFLTGAGYYRYEDITWRHDKQIRRDVGSKKTGL